MAVEVKLRRLRTLDIDLENRPLSYLGSDWTSAEITAVAWSWVGERRVSTLMLTPDGLYQWEGTRLLTPEAAFSLVTETIGQADMVTGHYIRKHDLPILNSACMELGLAPLRRILTQDTKMDLVSRKDLSASQENLAALFGLPEPKKHMSQTEWRTANRLTPNGIALSRKRVTDDVLQHKSLRLEMLKRGLLKAPEVWGA